MSAARTTLSLSDFETFLRLTSIRFGDIAPVSEKRCSNSYPNSPTLEISSNMAEEREEYRERTEAASRGPLTGSATTAVVDNEQLEQPAGLLEQFYATLRVTYLAAHQEASPADETVYKMIDALFEEKASWRAAYQIEQLLSLVLTEPQLDTELKRRMAEASELKLPYVKVFQELSEQASNDHDTTAITKRRAILHRLLNDLQWFYSQRYQRRLAAETLAYRVSRLFLYTFIVFFIVLFMQLFGHQSSDSKTNTPAASQGEIAPPTGAPESGS
jgi:hypothetical protein